MASILLLSACGQNGTTEKNDIAITENEKEKDVTESNTSTNDRGDGNEVKDGPLTKVGQWTKENDGTRVTLKKLEKLDKTIDMTPIKLTLKEIKVLERNGGTEDGNIIQISYTTENTSNEEIMFHPIKTITTNTKHQIDVLSENVSGSLGGGEFYGEVVKDGFIIVSYPEDNLTDLESLKLITGSVWNNDSPEILFEEVTEEIFFE